jgi:hypothetical protein
MQQYKKEGARGNRNELMIENRGIKQARINQVKRKKKR